MSVKDTLPEAGTGATPDRVLAGLSEGTEAALRTLIKRLDARHEASPGRSGGGAGPARADVIATGPAHTTGGVG